MRNGRPVCDSIEFECLIFFFSSRRRHTRYIGDWSSDVCSSDLVDEVHRDPALLEEALRLARLLTVGETEDLDLDHGIADLWTTRGWGPAVRGEPMIRLRGPRGRRAPWVA